MGLVSTTPAPAMLPLRQAHYGIMGSSNAVCFRLSEISDRASSPFPSVGNFRQSILSPFPSVGNFRQSILSPFPSVEKITGEADIA